MRNSASTERRVPDLLDGDVQPVRTHGERAGVEPDPSTAARRGLAPSQSQMSTAGMRMAMGHQPNGANDSESSMPATSAGYAADETAPDDFARDSLFLERPVFRRYDVARRGEAAGNRCAGESKRMTLSSQSASWSCFAAARQPAELLHDEARHRCRTRQSDRSVWK
jgi:hypothetical protein